MNEHDGTILDLDGTRALRFERTYDHPPGEVWSALTDPDQLARWFFRATFSGGVGGTVVFDLGEEMEGQGEILAWEEARLLEYTWRDSPDSPSWRIRFTLVAEGAGTRLVFDHLAPAPEPMYAAGWHWHLDRLALLVAGGLPDQVDSDEAFDALLAHYGGAPA